MRTVTTGFGSTPVRRKLLGFGIAAVLASIVLTGCVDQGRPSSPTTDSATVVPTPTSTAVPVLVPGGTAAENKPFFDYINNQVIEIAGGAPSSENFTDGLRSNGFLAEGMEATTDVTTVGVKADSIQFSVRAADACLIGQWGTAVQYHSIVAPVLSTGKCLVGLTKTID